MFNLRIFSFFINRNKYLTITRVKPYYVNFHKNQRVVTAVFFLQFRKPRSREVKFYKITWLEHIQF